MFIFWEAVILGREGGEEIKGGEKEKKIRYEEYEAKIF